MTFITMPWIKINNKEKNVEDSLDNGSKWLSVTRWLRICEDGWLRQLCDWWEGTLTPTKAKWDYSVGLMVS